MDQQQQLWDALLRVEGLAEQLTPEKLMALQQRMHDAQAHSAFALSWDAFCDRVSHALEDSLPHMPADQWLEASHLDDLHLCAACLAQEERAIHTFQQTYDRVLWAIVRRFATPPLMPEELYQELWIRLFVPTDTRRARLASYAAQGPLLGWLRVTAVRACIDYTRSHQHLKREQMTDKEELVALPQEALDIEIEFIKHEYRAHFRESFEAAIGSLSSHDRLLLRYHVVERLNIDQIGALMQFHRSTAARHLQQARQHLLQATEEQLMTRLHISPQEFESMLAMIQSRWDVSVQRLLAASSATLRRVTERPPA